VLAELTDDGVRAYADNLLTINGLSKNVRPAAIKASEALRQEAREHLNWCCHLGIGADNRVALIGGVIPTEFRTQCALHRYESALGSADFEAVTSAFKKVFCSECKDRASKADRTR
jgi:hypothetical protein